MNTKTEKTTHTPGPWEVRTDQTEYAPTIAEIYGMRNGSPVHKFQIVRSDGKAACVESAEADARLIARAPELAEQNAELRELVKESRREIHLVHSKDRIVYDPTLVIRLDAAIAKAEK